MSTVLSLDIATKTGYVIAVAGHIVESGTWNFSKKKADHEFGRLDKFRVAMNKVKKDYPALDTVVWERVDFARFVKAHALHNQLLAAVMFFVMDNDLEYTNVPVVTLKKFATGSGRAKKDDMLYAAKEKWPHLDYDKMDDNEIDARWINEFHLTKGKQ